jgi:hypothetical protein
VEEEKKEKCNERIGKRTSLGSRTSWMKDGGDGGRGGYTRKALKKETVVP